MRPTNLSRRFISPLLLSLWVMAQGAWLPGVGAEPPADELEIWIGSSGRTFAARERDGRPYYSLHELAGLLALELEEEGVTLAVAGPAGSLQLVDGRPLVGTRKEYILLSAPAWRREPGDWYVTEDFLTSALPLASSRRIDRISDGRYRLEELPVNTIRMEVQNRPGQVRIIFYPARPVPSEVTESDGDVRVEFRDLRIQPRFPPTPPDRRMVASIEFDPGRTGGVFRIRKGTDYGRFAETSLADPPGKVIDIFRSADTAEDRRPDASPVEAGGPIIARQIITLDPGHGGDDRGASTTEGLTEKGLVLRLAQQVGVHLTARGYGVTFTRTRDVELGADQRGAVANHYRAQAFVSFHLGAAQEAERWGPVVYFHRYGFEEAAPEPTDPTSPPPEAPPAGAARMVRWTDAQKDHLTESRRLAVRLQEDLNLLWGTRNLLHDVPLAGLAPVAAPAVLIETGFLTNPEDLTRLQSEEFREELSRTIASALHSFLEERPLQRRTTE